VLAPRVDRETLQATSLRAFSFQKFLNKTGSGTVFMNEGTRVLAGEAILNGAATVEHSRIEREKELLDALVREHSRLVYRVAYAVLRSHQDAEDATQETFLRVLRYSSKLVTVENLKTWLARIAWRVAVDRSKQQGRMHEISLEDPDKPVDVAASGISADQTVHGTQVSALLERLITALPAKLREPLILSTIEEMSPREIAATLGINEAAVRSRVFRARLILKEKLAGRAANGR
jgi:RNA polymerase sigma-70 factor (ECF subfamily)